MSGENHTQLSETPLVNEVGLNARQWLLALGLVWVAMLATPVAWTKLERFERGPDYRIPYELSKDYWLYQRRVGDLREKDSIVLLGDSVVWGEYVLPAGTLSHFLSVEAGQPDRFINAGVNGLFPLALEGLVSHYATEIRRRKVVLHCNLLWMSSPKADLQIQKEEKFNHPRLVPQFRPSIPCYRAETAERLGIIFERHWSLLSWVSHVQSTYFEQKSILDWTLADDGGAPPRYPNSYKNPLAQITFRVPVAPADDPKRGPTSPRHKSWTEGGASPARFEWVDLEGSLQWASFQRLVAILRARGNDLMVVLGPFNEPMIASENQAKYRALRDGAAAWFKKSGVTCIAPDALPSELYADASHPLTAGYELLAKRLAQDSSWQSWLAR